MVVATHRKREENHGVTGPTNPSLLYGINLFIINIRAILEKRLYKIDLIYINKFRALTNQCHVAHFRIANYMCDTESESLVLVGLIAAKVKHMNN